MPVSLTARRSSLIPGFFNALRYSTTMVPSREMQPAVPMLAIIDGVAGYTIVLGSEL